MLRRLASSSLSNYQRVNHGTAFKGAVQVLLTTGFPASPMQPWMVQRTFATKSDSDDDFKPKVHATSEMEKKDGGVQAQLKAMIEDYPILLFMKGTPQMPQCGFSQQVVRILHSQGVDFDSVNVLEHPALREGVKQFSQWPTIPQLYVKGEFVGGCDILTDMHKTGELEELLKPVKKVEDA